MTCGRRSLTPAPIAAELASDRPGPNGPSAQLATAPAIRHDQWRGATCGSQQRGRSRCCCWPSWTAWTTAGSRSSCIAVGDQFGPSQVPAMTLEQAQGVAQRCPVCRRAFCGRCCGVKPGLSNFEVVAHSTADMQQASMINFTSPFSRVIVLCGQHTYDAPNVLSELQAVQTQGLPYRLITNGSTGGCRRPILAKQSDKLYVWTFRGLKDWIDEHAGEM